MKFTKNELKIIDEISRQKGMLFWHVKNELVGVKYISDIYGLYTDDKVLIHKIRMFPTGWRITKNRRTITITLHEYGECWEKETSSNLVKLRKNLNSLWS